MSNMLEQSREIKKIWSGFQQARVLLTANNYRIFDYLDEPKSSVQTARILKTDRRATEILLNALTGLKLVSKKNNTFRNTSQSSRFLVSSSPWYQGDIIKHADGMWDSWSNLDDVVRTGKPARAGRNHEAFILGMHNLSVLKAGAILKAIGLNGVNRALDLGGGPGTYSIEMASKGVHSTLFDAPETKEIARKVINASGVDKGKIDFVGGNFFTEDIGCDYDLVLISQIFHAYSEKKNVALLKKCHRALNTGGRVVVQEFLINEARTSPVWSSLFAINMLVNTEGGRTYTPNEMKSWFVKAGFKSAVKKNVADGVLIISKK